MNIDIKSLIVGAVLGSSAVIYKASVAVAKDHLKKKKEEKKEA